MEEIKIENFVVVYDFIYYKLYYIFEVYMIFIFLKI